MSQKPARARVLIKGIRLQYPPMITSISRYIVVVALCAVAVKLVPTAAAQAPVDSAAAPAINLQVRPSAVQDSARRVVELAPTSRRVWAMQAGVEKRHTGRGALIGGVAGALLGAAAGGVIGGGFCDAADCRDVTRDGILFGGAIGAGIGVALGALIGYVW
jgi:hypothetical protein